VSEFNLCAMRDINFKEMWEKIKDGYPLSFPGSSTEEGELVFETNIRGKKALIGKLKYCPSTVSLVFRELSGNVWFLKDYEKRQIKDRTKILVKTLRKTFLYSRKERIGRIFGFEYKNKFPNLFYRETF